ncbi:MAG TPA: prenyltransferase [Acidimicrobiia bacterium]|nr:prenyltransferase [Acidimicrobiia bacterium]
MSALGSFVRLARPHFLLGGAVLYAVGAASVPQVELGHYLLGQAMVTSAQLTAHYVNEYADVDFDRQVVNRTWFSGGSGVLSAGMLRPQVALQAAIVSSLLTGGFALLVFGRSPAAAGLGALALSVSWLYSMPPVRLLDTGWGEAAASFVVAALVPLVGALANGGPVTAALLWAVAVLFLVHMGMLFTFELPDEASDRIAGKTVLAVRIGPESTHRLIVACFGFAAFVLAVSVATDQLASPERLAPAAVFAALTVVAGRRERFAVATWSAVGAFVLAALGLLGTV